jgi:hypothetical protein
MIFCKAIFGRDKSKITMSKLQNVIIVFGVTYTMISIFVNPYMSAGMLKIIGIVGLAFFIISSLIWLYLKNKEWKK